MTASVQPLEYNEAFKVLLICPENDVRTQLLLCICNQPLSRTMTIDQRTVKLSMLPFNAGRRTGSFVNVIFRGSRGILIVFDVTNQASFDRVHVIAEEVKYWC